MEYIIGCIAIFIVPAVGCYFWYRWETEPYREDYVKTLQLAEEYAASQQRNTKDVTQDATDTPAERETSTAEKPITDQTVVVHWLWDLS